MRKVFIYLFIVTILFSFSGCNDYTHGVYELSIKAELISNDSVGNDWIKTYTCDGKTITDGDQWTVPLETTKTILINATITENDKWDDVGSDSIVVTLVDDYKASTQITVTENKGRYKGNQAVWEITYRVKLVGKLSDG